MKKKILSVIFGLILLTNSATVPVYADVLCSPTAINTAIGCVGVLGGTDQFLGNLLRWAIGVGGGVAFLLILSAGFMIMTSAGDPTRLKAGQELLTSAIS